jgi:hypothetical protein
VPFNLRRQEGGGVAGKVTVEDWVEISNLIGKYQWLVDEGDEDGWADLFTEDGHFGSHEGQGWRGREALKEAAGMTLTHFHGRMRHSPGATWIEYGETQDEAVARYYSLVTTWFDDPGPEFFNMALCTMSLARIDGEWKIRSNLMKGLHRTL